MKYIFIMLLISSQLFGIISKLKVEQVDDIISTKVLIKHTSISKEEAKKLNKKASFITHITAKLDKNIILDISTSPFISRYPFIQFEFKSKTIGSKIEISIIDNEGIKNKKSEYINHSSKTTPLKNINNKSINFRKTHTKLWTNIKVKEAIKELYGNQEIIEGNLTIRAPELASNAGIIPITITPNVKLESLMLIVDNNPRPVVAVFNMPQENITSLSIKIKALNSFIVYINKDNEYDTIEGGNITIIGKASNGKLYQAKKIISIAGCINSGSGPDMSWQDYLKEVYLKQQSEKLNHF